MSCTPQTNPQFSFTVFTKPWKGPLPALGRFMRSLGVDGIELPVRPGYQATPDTVPHDVKRLEALMRAAAAVLADEGVRIRSIAAEPTPALIQVCAELAIPVIRVLAPIPPHQNFWEAVDHMHREWDPLLPELERHGVTLGIQNHCDRYLTHAMHLWYAIRRYDPRQVAAVWDPAHNALQGEDPDLALDILGDHLCMLSLKNARRRRRPPAHRDGGGWETLWTRGREGLADWRRIASEVRRRNWSGTVCLHAEYTQEHRVDELIAEDLAFARAVFAGDGEAATPTARPRTAASVIVKDRLAAPATFPSSYRPAKVEG